MTELQRKKAEEIFLSAVELPAREQPGFLAAEAEGDAEVEAEASSLLRYDSDGTHFDNVIKSAALSYMDDPAAGPLRAGHYRITGELGHGGMGAVYEAVRDDDVFRKSVAVKLMKRGMDTDTLLQRFRYERRILANLEHPFIARLIDGGTTEDGRLYFVMERVEGVPIDQFCRDAGLGVKDRLVLFRKVCEAVSVAHRSLIVHRDLKPGNILVCADGTPKLLDFGLAKILDPAEPSGETTAFADRLLTLQYASPEQLDGRMTTTATDVYSLGVVLYELLAGKRPHDIPSGTSSEAARIAKESEPVKPSAAQRAATAGATRQLAGDLDNIVMMALSKEPQRRYRSADEFSEDIRRYLSGLPVLAREDSLAYRSGKFIQRHRVGVLATAAFAISLAAGLTGTLWQARKAAVERDTARTMQARAEQSRNQMLDLANRTLFEVSDKLAAVPGSTALRRDVVTATVDYLNRLREDTRKTGVEDARLDETLADAYMRVGELQGQPNKSNIGDTRGALSSYREAVRLLSRAPRTVQVEAKRAGLVAEMSYVQQALGDSTGAIASLHEGLARAEAAARDWPDNEALLKNTGELHRSLSRMLFGSDVKGGLRESFRERDIYQRLLDLHPFDVEFMDSAASAYGSVATGYNLQARVQDGMNEQMKALALRELMAELRPSDALVQRELMIAYGRVGDFLGSEFIYSLEDRKRALPYFRKTLAIAQKLSSADPRNQEAKLDLGQALLRVGSALSEPPNLGESLENLEKAVEITGNLRKADPSNAFYSDVYGLAMQQEGNTLKRLGRIPEAVRAYRESMAAVASAAGDRRDMAARARLISSAGSLARLLAESHDPQALTVSDQSIERARGFVAGKSKRSGLYLARAYDARGDVYRLLGNASASCADYGVARRQFIAYASADEIETLPDLRPLEAKMAGCRH